MNIIKKLKKVNLVVALILIIPIILNVLWFKDGNIMATGESAAPFYNPSLQFNINKDAWAKYTLGHPTNIGVAAKPTYFLLGLGQSIGIPTFLLQAVFLGLMLFVAGLGIYYLTREFFPQIPKNIAFLATLFYWFNPFSLVNVWNRFLNNFIVFYAFLPLVLLLFIRGIKTKRYVYAVLIGLASFIFSYALSSITFSLILWALILYTTLFYLLFNKNEDKFFIIKFFILTAVIWILTSFWWISQVVSYVQLGSFSAVTSSSFTTNNNYTTFSILSQRLGNISDLLRLKHASFFVDTEHINWVGIYQFPVLTFLEFLIVGIFLLPVIIKRRQKEVLFLGGLFFITIFFAKGNNPPFGEIFDKAFLSFSFLQLFRNPLEKIGFILPLSSAPLFCLGIHLIIEKLRAKWQRIVYIVFFVWLLVIWGGPFWSSLVFTSTEIPTNKLDVGYRIEVPEFYQDAASWLSSQGDNFRLIILPIGGEGITYLWQKGYSGVELSNQLLPLTSVSFNTNIPFYDEVSNSLERIFLNRDNFPKVMNLLNAKYLVVRSDIDWKIRGMRDPKSIQRRLEDLAASGEIRQAKQFGDLEFWENLEWTDNTIYPARKLVKISGALTIEDILTVEESQNWPLYNKGDSLKADELVGSEVIRPVYKFGLGSKRLNTAINISDEFMFPTVRILPSEYLYPAISFKERIEMATIKDQNTLLLKKMFLLGKRLNEAQIEAEKGRTEGVRKALSLYTRQLKEVLPVLSEVSQVNGDFFLLQEDVYKIFLKHFDRLNKIKDAFPSERKEEVLSVEKSLRQDLIDLGIIPYFGYLDEENFSIKGRVVYQFNVEKDGNYELLLDSKSWNKYFKVSSDEPFLFQIDQELILRKGQLKNDLISYGLFNFRAGRHEIAWNTPDEISLVDTPSQLTMKVDHGVTEKSFKIDNFDPYSEYVLSLKFRIKRGSGVEVIISQNNDKTKKGRLEPRYDRLLGSDAYDFEIKDFSTYIIPSSTSDDAKLTLRVKPWNNCEDIYRNRGKEKCLDEKFRRPYDRDTEVFLSDISVVKTMTEVPILKREDNDLETAVPKISFKKINAGRYTVKVEGANKPFILVLSQLFDPAWKIYEDDQEIGKNHFLVNTYANGWVIDKSGDYELSIKFIPQDLLVRAEIISGVTIVGSLMILLLKLRKKHYEKN